MPLGTGNVLAATLGIPRRPLDAARRLATAKTEVIDTGLLVAGDVREHFAVACGTGFDARVMAATGLNAKARFGVLAYFATMMRLARSLPALEARIAVDGVAHELTAVAVLVANCGQIVPGVLGPRVVIDPRDGLLDVIAVRSAPFPLGVPVAIGSGLHALFLGDELHRAVAASARRAHRGARCQT